MDYKELIEMLRVRSYIKDDELCKDAAAAIETMLAERDAAVAELDRIAEFTESEFLGYLDNEIHPNCGYEYYTALFDLVCLVTHWEYADKWHGPTPTDQQLK